MEKQLLEATESGDLRILPEVLAGEVAVRRDTCVLFTGRDAGVLEEVASLFRTPYYDVWTSTEYKTGKG